MDTNRIIHFDFKIGCYHTTLEVKNRVSDRVSLKLPVQEANTVYIVQENLSLQTVTQCRAHYKGLW